MTSLVERQRIIDDLKEACRSGARLNRACETIGISLNSWSRWQHEGGAVSPDLRPNAIRPEPANQLSCDECEEILAVCNSARFASLPPSQIVPLLADEGRYIASESSFYRVLKKAGQTTHRGRAAAPRMVAKPTSYTAAKPNQVWSWDITWLPSTVTGQFYKLYLIEDIFSRFPVGWEVHEEESGKLAAELVQRAVISQQCVTEPLILHSDNGAAMKSYTLKAKLESLGITTSHNRPRVSNDNPYSEALFRTLKYYPRWPSRGFSTIDDARQWVKSFVDWYSNEHRHSGIRFVTPAQRHCGEDKNILQRRHQLYQVARNAHPERWSRGTRNWEWITQVHLNPETDSNVGSIEKRLAA